MAKQVQIRRGTTAELSSVTGAEGEVIADTTKDTLTYHDGYTAGGVPLLREDTNNLANNSVAVNKLAYGSADQALFTNATGDGVQWATLPPSDDASALTTGTISQDRFDSGSIVAMTYMQGQNGRSAHSGGSAGWQYFTQPAPTSAYTVKRSDTSLIIEAHITAQVNNTHMGATLQYQVNGGSWQNASGGYGNGDFIIPWGSNTNNCHQASSAGLIPNSNISAGDTIMFRLALYSPQNWDVVFGGNPANWQSQNYGRGRWVVTEIKD